MSMLLIGVGKMSLGDKRGRSKIIAIYAIIWLSVLAVILTTQEEITLYYASIF